MPSAPETVRVIRVALGTPARTRRARRSVLQISFFRRLELDCEQNVVSPKK